MITRKREGNGQALVEFALVLPVIVLVIFAVVDFGRGIYAYSTVAEAARQGTRVALVDQETSKITDKATTSSPLLGLSSANVTVCYKTAATSETDCSDPTADDCSSDLQIGCLAFVEVTSHYQPITPVLSTLFDGGIEMNSVSIVPIEYVCPTATKVTCP